MADLKSTEFTPHKTSIEGLIFFDVTSIEDERGYFQEKYHKEKLVKAGVPDTFKVVQNSISYNKAKGVTRGLHAEPWDKYISVVKGSVFAAYVDLRKGDGFGRVETIKITPNKAVFLPRGVANSFQTLEDDTYYIYSVNEHWRADNYDRYCFVNLADKELKIDWPINIQNAIINERDKNHPMLSEIETMEIL